MQGIPSVYQKCNKYGRTLTKYTTSFCSCRGYIVATMATAVYNNYVPTTLIYSDCTPRVEHINNQIADFHLETKRVARLTNPIRYDRSHSRFISQEN